MKPMLLNRILLAGGILLLCMTAPGRALDLTLADNTDDWLCTVSEARYAVAGRLALVAGQGWATADETYFLACIDDYAISLGLRAARLADLGASCAFQLTTTFADDG
jgi:hypothetical protein